MHEAKNQHLDPAHNPLAPPPSPLGQTLNSPSHYIFPSAAALGDHKGPWVYVDRSHRPPGVLAADPYRWANVRLRAPDGAPDIASAWCHECDVRRVEAAMGALAALLEEGLPLPERASAES